jgi:hypothetical protein
VLDLWRAVGIEVGHRLGGSEPSEKLSLKPIHSSEILGLHTAAATSQNAPSSIAVASHNRIANARLWHISPIT